MLMEDFFSDGHAVQVPTGTSVLDGELQLTERNTGLVVLAHAGSGRRTQARIQGLSEIFTRAGYATLRMDLLTEEEAEIDGHMEGTHFDSELLVERLDGTVDWLLDLPEAAHLPLALFGSSSGADAVLEVAADRGASISAVVAAGLAWDEPHAGLSRITAPTLLVAAEKDIQGLSIARESLDRLTCKKRLELIHGTGNLGNVLDKVARIASLWYEQYLV